MLIECKLLINFNFSAKKSRRVWPLLHIRCIELNHGYNFQFENYSCKEFRHIKFGVDDFRWFGSQLECQSQEKVFFSFKFHLNSKCKTVHLVKSARITRQWHVLFCQMKWKTNVFSISTATTNKCELEKKSLTYMNNIPLHEQS